MYRKNSDLKRRFEGLKKVKKGKSSSKSKTSSVKNSKEGLN